MLLSLLPLKSLFWSELETTKRRSREISTIIRRRRIRYSRRINEFLTFSRFWYSEESTDPRNPSFPVFRGINGSLVLSIKASATSVEESLFEEGYREIYGDPIYDIYEDDVKVFDHVDFIFGEGTFKEIR
ncbi:unnamed protein product, partial [Arabidopsis halleri]